MGDCSDLPEQHHVLLNHISKTKRTRRGGKLNVARDGLEQWQADLKLSPESVRLAYEDLLDDRWLRRSEAGLEINVLCRCPQAGAVIAPLTLGVYQPEAQGTELGGGTPFGGSATILRSRLRRANAQVRTAIEEATDEEAEAAAADFLNGAEEDPRPRRESPGQELVRFFLSQVPAAAKRQGVPLMATAISASALGGQIGRMLKEGMEPSEIRAMITLFSKQYSRFHKADADPAKVFLANRRRLYAQCQEKKRFDIETDPKKFAEKAAKAGRRYATLEDIVGAQKHAQ